MIHQIKIKKQHTNSKQLWRVMKRALKSQHIDIQHHTQTRVGKIHLPQSKQIIDNQPFKKQSYQSSIIQ